MNTKNMNTTTHRVTGRPVAQLPLRTPYHSLGGNDGMHVPEWAKQRSVYRTSGRTLYLVETDALDDARADLARLSRAGWDVQVTEDPDTERAQIALTRRDVARAA